MKDITNKYVLITGKLGILLIDYTRSTLVWTNESNRLPEFSLSKLDLFNVQTYVILSFFLGCDTGFGHMLAQRLDMLGVNVLAACLTDSAQNRLKSVTSSRLRTFRLDVTNTNDISNAVDFVTAQLPQNQGKC